MTDPEPPVARSIAAPVVIAIAALVLIALVVGGVLFVRSQLAETGEPLGDVVAEMVLDVRDADGSAIDGGGLDIAREIVAARLARSGIGPVAVAVDDDRVVVRFGEGVQGHEVDTARDLLDGSAGVDFRPVLRVRVGVDDLGCAPDDDATADSELRACNRERIAVYVLGPVAVNGANISAVTFGEVTGSGTADYSVSIALDDDGSDAFERVTGELARTEGQIALVVGNEVISAPRVMAAITGGELQIYGTFTREEAEALAREVDLARHGLVFAVTSIDERE